MHLYDMNAHDKIFIVTCDAHECIMYNNILYALYST